MGAFRLAGAAFGTLLTGVAYADSVSLSCFSSDETDPSALSALLDFSVSGSTLTVEVFNLTDGPDGGSDDGFDIAAWYFNASSDVTGLTLTAPPSGWVVNTNMAADGFGIFDFEVIDGVGSDPDQIDGEDSIVFTFSISGTGPFSTADFFVELSSIPPGDLPMTHAAKFQNGPGDDSAFGACPEPSAAALLALASLLGLRRR
jgi:hypothetical protein